jgi:hypothetical protein
MKTPGFAAILVVAGGWLPAACDNDQPVAELPQANDAVSLTASSAPTLEAREAAVDGNPLRDAYFGDTHVHTSYSLDAYIAGTRLTPADAYRFAKGETMVANGQSYRLGRPLDFAAISDHAENLGEMYSAQVKGAPGYDAPELEELRNLQTFEAQEAWFVKYVQASNRSGAPAHPPFYAGPGTSKRGWQVIVDAARAHYEPGRFTTIAAFEWSAAPNGGNMHRNVLFRDLEVPDMPFSAIDSSDEEDLWMWMLKAEANGATLFAIPHNSNASKTQMF